MQEVKFAMEIESGEVQPAVPVEWPQFETGELFDVKGLPFELARLNASTLVLRPIPPEGWRAREVMREVRE